MSPATALNMRPLWSSTLACVVGCSYHAFAPPARVVPLESPQVLPAGAQALSGQVISTGTVWGPNFVGGSLRYRRGLTEQLDGTAEVTVMHVTDAPSEVHAWPQGYTLRVGAKFQPLSFLALGAGLGGGGSAFGGFISPELDAIIGYENPYVVPFLSGRAFMSQPFAARSVFVGREGDDDHYAKPQTTLGLGVGLGLRIPLQHHVPAAHAVLLGASLTVLFDRTDRDAFFSLSAGVELVL